MVHFLASSIEVHIDQGVAHGGRHKEVTPFLFLRRIPMHDTIFFLKSHHTPMLGHRRKIKMHPHTISRGDTQKL